MLEGSLISHFKYRTQLNGREGTSSFWKESFGPENWARFHTHKKLTVLLPHSSMDGRHSERPPRRDAIYLVGGLGLHR